MHDNRSSLYHRHRFAPEIITEAVWLYFASIHDPIYKLHHFPRNLFTSAIHRELRQTANAIWHDIARL